MLVSLEQTEQAVRLAEEAKGKSRANTTAESRSRYAFASVGAIANGFAPAIEPDQWYGR